jgi:hypothetical protein
MDGCTSAISLPYELIITGIENKRNENWQLIPNPAVEKFVIRSSKKIDFVELFDTNGKVIRSSTLNEMWIDDLANGVYFVRINQTYVQKLVIQH